MNNYSLTEAKDLFILKFAQTFTFYGQLHLKGLLIFQKLINRN